jgi:hypothetical protein
LVTKLGSLIHKFSTGQSPQPAVAPTEEEEEEEEGGGGGGGEEKEEEEGGNFLHLETL